MPLGCGRNRATSGWCVLHTHPQAERWACANLTRAGYRTYLPLYLAPRRDPVLPNTTRLVERTLFPNYAFVQHDIRSPWTPIRYSPGIERLLMNHGTPYLLADAAVEALQAGDALRATHLPNAAQWASGDACTPRVGIFLGHPAVVMEVADETVRIGLMFLGELRQIVMPIDCITARDE